jgi:hypothetical protein
MSNDPNRTAPRATTGVTTNRAQSIENVSRTCAPAAW